MAGLHHAVELVEVEVVATGDLRELVAGRGGAVAPDKRGVERAEREEGERGRQHGKRDAPRTAGEGCGGVHRLKRLKGLKREGRGGVARMRVPTIPARRRRAGPAHRIRAGSRGQC